LRQRAGILEEFEIDPVDVLRVVTLIAELPDPGKSSAIFNLTGEQVSKHWDDAIRGIAMALELLKDQFGVIEKQWLPYAPMVIPLAGIQAKRPRNAQPEDGTRLQKLHRWYWCSVFSGSYSQAAGSKQVSDFVSLTRWLHDEPGAELPVAVRTFQGFDRLRLREISRKVTAEYKACIGVLLHRDLLDLADGRPLLADGRRPNQLQRRSLFPKIKLSGDVPRAIQDSILNVTMTRTKMSGFSGQRAPSEYLAEYRQTLGARYDQVLQRHLLPSDSRSGFARDKFDQFLDERSELFAAEIERLTGVPSQNRLPRK